MRACSATIRFKPINRVKRDSVAVVDETRCIGCALCIEACPVDAIVGARGMMHSVIEAHCIGCDLCVPPCPVDCISMVASTLPWTAADAALARRHARRRKARLAARESFPLGPKDARRAVVDAAIERVRERQAAKAKRAG